MTEIEQQVLQALDEAAARGMGLPAPDVAALLNGQSIWTDSQRQPRALLYVDQRRFRPRAVERALVRLADRGLAVSETTRWRGKFGVRVWWRA